MVRVKSYGSDPRCFRWSRFLFVQTGQIYVAGFHGVEIPKEIDSCKGISILGCRRGDGSRLTKVTDAKRVRRLMPSDRCAGSALFCSDDVVPVPGRKGRWEPHVKRVKIST